MIICSSFIDAALLYDMLADVSTPWSRGVGTMAATLHSFPILDAMVHVNSQLDANSIYVSYRELLPRGKTAREQFLRPVARRYRKKLQMSEKSEKSEVFSLRLDNA